MGDVRILPEILSNKIAAGEVVERPVSVVKELMENALDANATAITVEIERGGRDLIRVSDNGRGMGRDDAILCIERYATSKIFTDEDLFSIHTFGFRGEALPSIASVSNFVLTTRTMNSDAGTRVRIRGGKILDVTDAGAPQGTMVEVKQLYFNTPARRKFLKSINTEMGHIADVFSGMALGNPGIGFRLFHNGRPVKRFAPQDDSLIRAGEVLGSQFSEHLFPVEATLDNIVISGFVTDPDITQPNPGKTRLFVNNRMISDRGILSAVFRGFQGRIMKGRFPIALLFIDLPVDQVDVNVHPSKLHVRFSDAGGVYATVVRAVQNALAVRQKQKYQGLTSPGDEDDGNGRKNQAGNDGPRANDKNLDSAAPAHFQSEEPSNSGMPARKDRPKIKESEFHWKTRKSIASKPPTATKNFKTLKEDYPEEALGATEKRAPVKRAPLDSPRIIGQVLGIYILLESENGLVLLDQHAAHERIVYERLKKRSQLFNPPSQTLAVPETLELDFREADLLETIIPDLARLGISLESFGGNSFIVKSVPALIDDRDIRPLIRDMLGEIMASNIDTGDEVQKRGWLDECLKLMACHHAIRAGKRMNPAEMEALVRELESCGNPYHCPHGRPTRIELSGSDLQKMFKRIV